MKHTRFLSPLSLFSSLLFALCLGAALTVLFPQSAAAQSLGDEDCVKCHLAAVKDVAANGAAHGEMGCQDCHLEHAPLGTDIIPACALCHSADENPHYALANCSGCHAPHHPLLIDFSALTNVKPACLSCHPGQGQQMAAHPSAHSVQDCNACHTAHGLAAGQFLNCLDCHEGHSPTMTVADCGRCHQAHSPVEVTYGDIPSALCASCHDDIATMLAKSTKLHAKMTCSECHSGQHKAITPCIDCHGEPHGVMHKKYPNCVECHINPHALAE